MLELNSQNFEAEVKESEQEQNDKDHERKHGREAVSIKLEGSFIHGGNENIRLLLRAALCDQVDDIEFVECPNHAEDNGGSEDGAKQGQGDVAELLPSGGTVNFCGFIIFL